MSKKMRAIVAYPNGDIKLETERFRNWENQDMHHMTVSVKYSTAVSAEVISTDGKKTKQG